MQNRYALSEDNVRKNPEALFTYSVKWHYRSDLLYADRNVVQGEFQDDLELHWISVINSFILVMMLVAFLSIVMLRILKRDFSRYMDLETGDDSGIEDDSGWKLVHADVFRVPTKLSLFCALNGAGAQLFTMLFGVLISSLLGLVKPNKRGGMMAAFIILYALTAGVGGYQSARMYRQLGGYVAYCCRNSLVLYTNSTHWFAFSVPQQSEMGLEHHSQCARDPGTSAPGLFVPELGRDLERFLGGVAVRHHHDRAGAVYFGGAPIDDRGRNRWPQHHGRLQCPLPY